ncbi:MAG: hypothetical protein WA954_08935 [Parerythrobacter sp.]
MRITRPSIAALALAGVAFGISAPAFAKDGMQPDLRYPPQGYEFAVPGEPGMPVPTAAQAQQQVIFQPKPVVQSVPYQQQAPQYVPSPVVQQLPYETQYVEQPYQPQTYQTPVYQQQPVAPVQYAAPVAQPPYQQPYYQQTAPSYDREAWLDECYDRVRGENSDRGSAAVGGVLGAAAGGVLGNRIAGSGQRLGGTLLGAGIGGLVGVLGGSAIDRGAGKREAREYCEDYLTQYEAGQSGSQYYPQQVGYGHGGYGQVFQHGGYIMQQPQYGYYPAPVQYVQVLVPVEQRAVVREYVEYVTVPETVYEEVEVVEDVVRERVIHRPAPAKRLRYKKGN